MNSENEIEATFYAKVTDFTGLSQADDFEEHVQVEARFMNGIRSRVREIIRSDDTKSKHVFTIKTNNNGQNKDSNGIMDSLEYSVMVSEEFFNIYSKFAERKMIKTRYYFKNKSISIKVDQTKDNIVLDNVGFEVDIFKTKGTPCQWAKIDIEIDPLLKELEEKYPEIESFNLKIKTIDLPFKPVNIIFVNTATNEQKEMIDRLWNTEYTVGVIIASMVPAARV